MNNKICKICKLDLSIDCFSLKKFPNGFYYVKTCKDCAKALDAKNKREKYKENSDKIKESNKKYYRNNSNSILEDRKVYYKDNKQKLIKRSSNYAKRNRLKLREYERQRRIDKREYVNFVKSQYDKNKRKSSVEFRIRKDVSRCVNLQLRKNGSSKNNRSLIDYLPYSIQELKDHLQSQFEPWMSWNNWGKYNVNTWNDHNTLTWTWNIDHIIPQSKLPYTSMEDENFKKCWSLGNLRPLSAKQNIIDGNRK